MIMLSIPRDDYLINNMAQEAYLVNYPQHPIIYHGLTSAAFNRGMRSNGRISPIRRFFCLFVTFDLLLTSLLWLIVLVLSGDFDWNLVYHQQILHYSIKTSLFDIVMSAISRFVILLLFYALLEISHWCIVAFTTAFTCIFLASKVYVFDWGDSSTQVLQVVLILTSFILVWSEVWLVDIKVIPQEKVARDYFNSILQNERAPLVNSSLARQYDTDAMSGSINFYSPDEFSSDSSDNEQQHFQRGKKRFMGNKKNDEVYKNKAREILKSAWDTINSDNWRKERTTSDGEIIESRKLDEGQRVFRLKGKLSIGLIDLKTILYDKLEDFPQWNETLKEAKVIQKIDNSTDVSYQISKKKTIAASREFITLRHYEEIEGNLVIASGSIIWPRLVSSQHIVRGENGPGCWALRSISKGETEVRWLLNTNINAIWFPQSAIDASLIDIMAQSMMCLRKHCLEFQRTQSMLNV